MREVAASLRDEDVIDLFSNRLPELLERRPDLEPTIFGAFLKTFARREEVALVLTELRTLRTEMNQRFERVEQRFERVDQGFEQVDQQMHEVRTEVATGFGEVQRSIDRLGARWGIRSESVFRQTMAAVLEQSFGVGVEQRTVAGEQFDIVIHDHEHILVEIAASVGPTIQTRLERKRRLYQESTGVSPTRIILATASIHSRRAHELRMSGIEVIEPEETEPAAT
jgi:hypothetical protein